MVGPDRSATAELGETAGPSTGCATARPMFTYKQGRTTEGGSGRGGSFFFFRRSRLVLGLRGSRGGGFGPFHPGLFSGDLPDGLSPAGGVLAAESPDPGHMVPIGADPFASLPPCGAGLVGGEFVGRPLLVSGPAAFARDFPLFFPIHRREATVTCAGLHPSLHWFDEHHHGSPFPWYAAGPDVALDLQDSAHPGLQRYRVSGRGCNSDTIRNYRTRKT